MDKMNSKGQSTFEYILLLAVVMLMFSAFFKSQLFQDYLGVDGQVFTSFKSVIESGYQMGAPDQGPGRVPSPSSNHPLYQGKFFVMQEEYPQ